MMEIGTIVKVNMANNDDTAIISLLNKLGGEVVKDLGDKRTRVGYLVAYAKKHIPAIERARELDEKNGLGVIYFKTLGKTRPKEFPNDPRYYLLAFEDEIKPV